MADLKITELDANTTPIGADLVAIVDDVAGTPVTQKMTLATLDTHLSATTQTLTNKTLTSPTITGASITVAATESPSFSASPSSVTSLVQYTVTKITYGTEEWDTNSDFASSRFTPTVAGYYIVNASVSMATTAALTYIYIYKNGSAYKSGVLSDPTNWTTVSCQVSMNGSTDYLEIYVQQNAATQNNETTASSNFFQATMIRSA